MALLLPGLLLVGAGGGPTVVRRPEGYLRWEVDDDAGVGPNAESSFSVTPAPPALDAADAGAVAPDEIGAGDRPPELPASVPPKKTARELCQPIANRFATRLAELRGNPPPGAGGPPLDPVVQRAMFGRQALAAPSDSPDEPLPELTWDSELKDLYRTWHKCLKAQGRRR